MKFKRWYFYFILVFLFFVPSYSEKPYDSKNSQDLISQVLSHPLIYQNEIIYGLIKIIFIFILVLFFYRKDLFLPYLNFYLAFLFLITAFFQTTAYTKDYGFVILIGNGLLNLFVSFMWFIQGFKKNRFNKINSNKTLSIVFVLLAIVAFYFPIDASGKHLDLTLKSFFLNNSMVTFCMITPIALTLTYLYFNAYNIYTLRITAFVGTLFGIMNMLTWFILSQDMMIMGFLHLPLLLVSLVVFVKTKKLYQIS